jgi:hypothetical protein
MRRAVLAAVLLAIGAALASSSAALASSTVALAQDVPTPTFTLTPSTGPAGTQVSIEGQLTSMAQVPIWSPRLAGGDNFFALYTDISTSCPASGELCTPGPANLAGCELLVAAIDPVIHLDESTGQVTGSFVVGGDGTCSQSDPDAATHQAPPGPYELSIGCPACGVASFGLTRAAGSVPASATLPFTGRPFGLMTLTGGVLVVWGFVILAAVPTTAAAGLGSSATAPSRRRAKRPRHRTPGCRRGRHRGCRKATTSHRRPRARPA